jgi:hypothetical protein
MHLRKIAFALVALFVCSAAFAQQTGSISGQVTTDGVGLPGVTVEARSNVLPQARVAVTEATGDYRLPALQPGRYTLTFTLSGMQTVTRTVEVLLGQNTPSNVNMGVAALAETIVVTAEMTMVDPASTAIKTGVSSDMIQQVPVGQEYRDLLKLAPAVQLNDAAVRGPAAGGSEQDNVYQFDGVNVTLPLFGTLAAEPSTHDIAQVSILKGGAKAVDFNRAGGMTVDSVSKSGTSEWAGELKYQVQTDAMTSELVSGASTRFDENRDWASANIGGPVLRDRLFVYGSYYRPTRARDNVTNLYGEVPDFDSLRNEYFGKLTATPTSKILLNVSYRDSDRRNEAASIANNEAPTVALGEESTQRVGILEGSWVISDRSFATLKYNDYGLKTSSRPDTLFPDVTPSAALGTQLDINNLDRLGYANVPCPSNRPAGSPCALSFSTAPTNAFNTFITPFINKYGYVRPNGERAGGSAVGGGVQINDQDFYRDSFQVAYDFTLGSVLTHDIHVGFMRSEEQEDLARFSNGWGSIVVQGGSVNCPAGTACAGQPVFFQTTFTRSTEGTLGEQVINSWFEQRNVEINDTIRWGDWAFNLGVLASNDIFFGEGLAEADNIAGFVASPGTRYEMYDIGWSKQIQPRLGATWAYNGTDTVYASYAKYNPALSSLPRAAAWDRNTLGLTQEVFFDATGKAIGSRQVAASSGKLFVEDLDPRYTDEYMIGTSQQFTPGWSGRFYTRYRYSTNFWEDTNNNARIAFKAPPEIAEKGLYIPNLGTNPTTANPAGTGLRGAIGSGSSYVIAELDGAFTKYYEATLESNYRRGRASVQGTYTWSHYYGNMDQDNTSTTYDFATFVGSSNIADGGGRQLWDNKYGDLHADRRHIFKLFGYYTLPWNASAGAFTLYQSGHAWEMWSWEPYGLAGSNVIGTSTSDTNRYAEPAGRRRTDDHYQLDLNYTQNFSLAGVNLQLSGDLFNVFDKQTGYSPQPAVHLASFGQPRIFHSPRRFQIAAKLQF